MRRPKEELKHSCDDFEEAPRDFASLRGGMFNTRESPSYAKVREVRTLEGNCRCIICVMPGRAFEKTSMLPRFRI